MVIASAPTTAPKTHRQRLCPRCEASLIMTYDEPECLQCGFVDYAYTPPTPIANKKSLISAGTRYIFRYTGDAPNLAETLAHVHLRRIRNRVVYGVACPFCRKLMDQSSLSGKRRELREERYRCPDGHRVSLIPKKDGNLGWK